MADRLQEFAIEIPDAEADEIQTVEQGLILSLHVRDLGSFFLFPAIEYIAKTPEGTFNATHDIVRPTFQP